MMLNDTNHYACQHFVMEKPGPLFKIAVTVFPKTLPKANITKTEKKWLYFFSFQIVSDILLKK